VVFHVKDHMKVKFAGDIIFVLIKEQERMS